MDYAEKFALASDRQGTSAIKAVLEFHGIPSVIEQTGGFTMLVAVYGTNGKWIGINDDCVYIYGGEISEDGDEYDDGVLVFFRDDTESNVDWHKRALAAVQEREPVLDGFKNLSE
jgi:hypothetical protein